MPRPEDMASDDAAARTWFGHPPGLTVLFLTQMWECFSYYGMRALLVYYMMGPLGFSQQKASLIYGGYSAMVMLSPIAGGILSDLWLGRRLAVILGGSIMALGHFMLTFGDFFFLALATLILGSGLFIPSLPSQIRELYSNTDPRRSISYNVYYVGINTGGFLAPLVCGALAERIGWHWGFGAAGIGMVIGLLVYLAGQRFLPAMPKTGPEIAANLQVSPLDAARRWRFLILVGLCVIIFRCAYEQLGNTIAVWAMSEVDRSVMGFEIPATWFQALNSLFVVALSPPIILLWRAFARRYGEIPEVVRMGMGAFFVALAYVGLAFVAATPAASGHSWLWLTLAICIITIGELWILPVGLGLFGRLAPARFSATAIAAWYLAGFAGNLLAGVIGLAWSGLGPAGFFLLAAALATIAGALLIALLGPSRAITAQAASRTQS